MPTPAPLITTETIERQHHLKAIAIEAHRLLLKAARDKGLARHREHGVEGHVVPTTIASFVWAASSSVGGDPIDERDVDVIRSFLKVTGNVRSLGKITDGKYRVFVASTWDDNRMPATSTTPTREPDAIDKRASRLTAREVGEDRDPAPVIVRRAKGHTYVYEEARLMILRHLAIHGRVESDDGLVVPHLADLLGFEDDHKKISSDVRHLARRGLIGREKPNSRRTNAIWITDDGMEVLNKAIERGHLDPIEAEVDEALVVEEEDTPTPSPTPLPARTPYDRALAQFSADLTDRLDTLARTLADERVGEDTMLRDEIRKIMAMDLTPIQMLAAIEEEVG